MKYLKKIIISLIFLFIIILTLFFTTKQNKSLTLWSKEAKNLEWFKPFKKTLIWNFPYAHWFAGGELNASYLCVDRNIKNKNSIAIQWESENGQTKTLSYQELYEEVNKLAKTLQDLGVKKSDKVIIYMPMIPESVAAALATVRLGAIHSIVFSGFSAVTLKERIEEVNAKYIICADYTIRRGKKTDLKKNVEEAIDLLVQKDQIKKVLIIDRDKNFKNLNKLNKQDVIYSQIKPKNNIYISPVPVESNHPLFILYTSGTTGKPNGIVHSTGGYLVYCYSTFKWVFAPQEKDVYWCTADISWITGHSYLIYAPLMHCITIFMHEGAPDYPDPGIWWKLIEKYKINIFYTAPTALRMAIKSGDKWHEKYDLSSLRILGSVGEPINPDVWEWYYKKIGDSKCPVVDTWWQTETGGIMISPMAIKYFDEKTDLSPQKFLNLLPGSATKPLPTIKADIFDKTGKSKKPGKKGFLVIKEPWPGMLIDIYKNPKKFKETYWSKFPKVFYSGDYAYEDKNNNYWILGRADEVLNISGHRIGTIEIENATLKNPNIAEVAAVGIPDWLRGEKIVLFVVLKDNTLQSEELKQEITETIIKNIGEFAKPKEIYFKKKLPKTNSGKIKRALLKQKLAAN